MLSLDDLCRVLEAFAPPVLSEDWDNVGLLVGERDRKIERVMTCLTITPDSAAEAIERQADVIVAHHPLPFQPLKRITSETTVGRLLLGLIRANIAIYSPHTAFDSAAAGINQGLAEGLGLLDIEPLEVSAAAITQPGVGSGRLGRLPQPTTLSEIAAQLKTFLKIKELQLVGDDEQLIERVALACGSAGGFLKQAIARDCQLFVTGETTFHTCLEADARGIALLLPGHYASERFGIERLSAFLAQQFPQLVVWPSESEGDPLRWG